jgi:hypothetical protein
MVGFLGLVDGRRQHLNDANDANDALQHGCVVLEPRLMQFTGRQSVSPREK